MRKDHRVLLPAHNLKIKAILFRYDKLSDWEIRFIRSLVNFKTVSLKQIYKIDEIYNKVMDRVLFVGMDYSWDEVHDFDR